MEVNSNTSLPQETREPSHKQPNFMSRVTRKKDQKTPKVSRRNKNHKNQSRNKRKRSERDYGK